MNGKIKKMYEDKIKRLEKQLIREAIALSRTFATKERNRVIKTAIQIQTLKNL